MRSPSACPAITSLQRIVLYETQSRFFLVGSNHTESKFRVLKIDRTEPRDLDIIDDKIEYSQKETQDLLSMIDEGNRVKVGQKTSGLMRTVSAFGIVGFVRFLEGYYIILITKRRRVALVGGHTFFKIEDTSLIYIPNRDSRIAHPDESKYVKSFLNVDLSSNFYFSYSYDLTHSLQYNVSLLQDVEKNSSISQDTADDEELYRCAWEPYRKYVWNNHLLKDFEKEVLPEWVLYIIHGFIGQSNLCVFGRAIFVTLVARRSSRFAGTRFLKRGANCQGDVANQVETEQMVHDSSLSSFDRGSYTSYVQLRGSIPLHWSQDTATIVPKPTILLDLADPYAQVAGMHFNEVIQRFGAPIIIFNLVKKREKKQHESILGREFTLCVKCLNQFLPPSHTIQYIAWDMAKHTKNNKNVMAHLAEVAGSVIKKTSFFSNLSGPSAPDRFHDNLSHKQTGVLRTNCVDCLDRTNTAQFSVGKAVLGQQLYALGVINSPTLDFDSDAVRMLEELYEDQGDTLALQYGGSQLVHSISTYRKTSPFTSHSRDIMQTLSRYYSNAFSDAEKQNAINLFLGVFVPELDQTTSLWEMTTDYYLHHINTTDYQPHRNSYTEWLDRDVKDALPQPYDEVWQQRREVVRVSRGQRGCEQVDVYLDHYRPDQLTSLHQLFTSIMIHSIRDFMPKNATNYSPFTVRITQQAQQGPWGTFRSSTATISGSSSDEEDSSSNSEEHGTSVLNSPRDSNAGYLSFSKLFPTMKEVYGVELVKPSRKDMDIYQRFVSVDLNARHPIEKIRYRGRTVRRCMKRTTRLIPTSAFSLDSSYNVTPPTTDRKSKAVYERHVETGLKGVLDIASVDFALYREYSQMSAG